MKNKFASRILELRKERGISQKSAAEKLEISQALLSHYENGIRECSLDFICKVSSFYDVSCDYLLGVIDTRRSFDEEFDKTDIPQDEEFRTSTLFRAAAMLHDSMVVTGNDSGEKIKNYFAMTIYKLAVSAAQAGVVPKDWINLSQETATAIPGLFLTNFSNNEIFKVSAKSPKPTQEPECVKTVIEKAESIITEYIESLV